MHSKRVGSIITIVNLHVIECMNTLYLQCIEDKGNHYISVCDVEACFDTSMGRNYISVLVSWLALMLLLRNSAVGIAAQAPEANSFFAKVHNGM